MEMLCQPLFFNVACIYETAMHALHVRVEVSFSPLYTSDFGKQQPLYAAFHKGLLDLLRQERPLEKKMQFNLKIITSVCICTIGPFQAYCTVQ